MIGGRKTQSLDTPSTNHQRGSFGSPNNYHRIMGNDAQLLEALAGRLGSEAFSSMFIAFDQGDLQGDEGHRARCILQLDAIDIPPESHARVSVLVWAGFWEQTYRMVTHGGWTDSMLFAFFIWLADQLRAGTRKEQPNAGELFQMYIKTFKAQWVADERKRLTEIWNRWYSDTYLKARKTW